MSLSRRDFLRMSCCSAAGLGLAAGISRFGLINAYAQSSPGYKALVCIFLFGGNDGNNLIIPMSGGTAPGSYQNYANLRAALALPFGSLMGTTVTTVTGAVPYAFHPQFTNLARLWNQRKASVLANVGTLVTPITKTQWDDGTAPVPSNLFSHSDQQMEWQTSDPTQQGSTGWAGRVADSVRPIYDPRATYPTITTVAGANIFTVGVAGHTASSPPGATSDLNGFDTSDPGQQARLAAMQQLLTFDTGLSMVQAASSITGQAFADSNALAAALAQGTPFQTVFPNTDLGSQLQQVARIIQVHSRLGNAGLNRQIFFCSIGGFDTHTGQLPDQNQLFSVLDPAMGAFYDATVEMNVSSQVTTFTLSDFGRTLKEASGAGSDHAWGNHHIVMGGAVQGGDLYGKFPIQELSGPDDATDEGRWIPTTSLDQYAATLALWFGVPSGGPGSINSIFPNLGNFSAPKLGFLG
jgi:uncharacterized protein (DUF1501 family)